MVSLPELPCIAFRILAERLVWSGASGHGTRRGPGKCGWRSLGDLLPEVSNPFLLLICCQGQQEHVSGRGHIVVYCVRVKNRGCEPKDQSIHSYFKDGCLNAERTLLAEPAHNLFFYTSANKKVLLC